MSDKIFGVSELNERIKALLDSDSVLNGVYVRGELSNYKTYPSGHHYFTMKDSEGALRCVMFRGSASKLRVKPENGMNVIVFGRVTVFPRDGAYQLYADTITPDGVGELHVAFEQLKEKLFKEGLFDAIHKKPIPRYPDRIAVITSSAGAAVRDVIRVLGRRYPLAKVLILPVRVQGEEAPPEIVEAIGYVNKYNIADVIITGRGGGSIEDLWAFNDERVARAIFASRIPVISAVGHEPDVTIADFVADARAATPSHAAEMAVPDGQALRSWIAQTDARMGNTVAALIQNRRERVDFLMKKRVMQSPLNFIQDKRLAADLVMEKLASASQRFLFAQRQRLGGQAVKLDALSPLRVLGRGYSLATRADGVLVRQAADVTVGDLLTTRFRKGWIQSRVSAVEAGQTR